MSNELDKAKANLDHFKQKKEANDVSALALSNVLITDTPVE